MVSPIPTVLCRIGYDMGWRENADVIFPLHYPVEVNSLVIGYPTWRASSAKASS